MLEFITLIDLIAALRFPPWIREGIPLPFVDWEIKFYGLAYIAGVYGAYFYALKMSLNKDAWLSGAVTRAAELIPSKTMLQDLMFYCLLGIILGGRIGYIIFYAPETLANAPMDIFKVWEGGMSFHGGFLGVCAAVFYMCKVKKLGLMRIADLTAIGAPIGLGLVRLTNFINQELYGRATDLPWGMIFPKDPDALPRHPSQLYEAFLEGLVIFLILRVLCLKYKALTRPGICTGAFIFLYGIFRFCVEFVREPDFGIVQFGPLTRGMTYSLPMIIIGLLVLLWALRRPPVSPKRVKDDAEASSKA